MPAEPQNPRLVGDDTHTLGPGRIADLRMIKFRTASLLTPHSSLLTPCRESYSYVERDPMWRDTGAPRSVRRGNSTTLDNIPDPIADTTTEIALEAGWCVRIHRIRACYQRGVAWTWTWTHQSSSTRRDEGQILKYIHTYIHTFFDACT